MLLDIKCSTVVSVKVNLAFDDGTTKERVIGLGDLIDVEFNCNGLRRRVEGRVIKIYTEGADPKKWYIIVDSADDFDSKQYRFSPMNILDLEVVQKRDATQYIYSTNDYTNIQGLRIVKGRIQYTQNGHDWYPVKLDPRDIIRDEEGTAPYNERPMRYNNYEDDELKDEVNA